MENIKKDISKESLLGNKMFQVVFFVFFMITIWWFFTHPFDSQKFIDQKHIWSSSYVLISLLGGFFGFVISKYWGGAKSVLGRCILFFSIGLVLQSFGQLVYDYYTLFAHIETPYPSLGDIGYFGSIFAYIYGVYLLGRVSGMKISFKYSRNQILAILIPGIMIVLSYIVFLRDYHFDWSKPLTIFLDFGYPMGQAMYVSIVILVLLVSRKFLGGLMKKPIMFLLVALLIQYFCDSNFLYQANQSVWYAGCWGDYLYVISYLSMTISLIQLGTFFEKIKNS